MSECPTVPESHVADHPGHEPDVCDKCGCDALIIVRGYPFDMTWEAKAFDPHPDREEIEDNDLDWEEDPDCEKIYAHACPKCRRVVPGSYWFEKA